MNEIGFLLFLEQVFNLKDQIATGFLEQWIPFDISNMSVENIEDLNKNIDFKNGRSGDWRLATKEEWETYHPSHDNYQIRGKCRRWIGKSESTQ